MAVVDALVRFFLPAPESSSTAFRFVVLAPSLIGPTSGMLTSGTATAPEGMRTLIPACGRGEWGEGVRETTGARLVGAEMRVGGCEVTDGSECG